MQISKFGHKYTSESGILHLMDDLGKALATGDTNICMLGGGNPATIPQVQTIVRQRMYDMLLNEGEFEAMVGNYGSPQGEIPFISALADLLQSTYGWRIGPENIALTNGSQTAFFYLFNLLAGEFEGNQFKRIVLPLAPEYIGYADVGLTDDYFVAYRPEIEYIDDLLFKYHVHFQDIKIDETIGAICVSRPTNPTGNVLTDEEIARLHALAHAHDIPLIIDNAYGAPFPDIIFTETQPIWDDHIILCMSLSKVGLPGARTGIIIASEEVVSAISSMNAIFSLSPGNLGAGLALDMVRSGDIMRIGKDIIQPYYSQKVTRALSWLRQDLQGVPAHVHKPEGAFFLWLWFDGLPITSAELYQRLKKRGVIVVPGHYFFPGLKEAWRHKNECLRVSYAAEEETVRTGLRIIGEEVKRAYADA